MKIATVLTCSNAPCQSGETCTNIAPTSSEPFRGFKCELSESICFRLSNEFLLWLKKVFKQFIYLSQNHMCTESMSKRRYMCQLWKSGICVSMSFRMQRNDLLKL